MESHSRAAAGAVALLTLVTLLAGETRAACPDPTAPSVVLRPTHDSRLMNSHPNANDGAAGLIWLKRSSHVRGVVGFDLSCQAAATADLSCAELGASVYEGNPRVGGSYFDAHRLLVPWIEGTQSFNEFKFGAAKLGSFGGTGPGTTWDCRIDPEVADNTSEGCAPEDKWKGANDCGGIPCYDPSASTAVYVDGDTTLTWDVTSDVVGETGEASWLLKVQDESVKSGSVKIYTRDGARFMAENETVPGGATRFDEGPRLVLRGEGLVAPSATLVAPVGVAAQSPAAVRITQSGPSTGSTARWENTTTGEWGWMTADGVSDWTALIPLVPGENDIAFTVFDGCGTEGKLHETITLDGPAPCGAGAAECSVAFLCYGAKTTSGTEKFDRLPNVSLTETTGPTSVNVRRRSRICVPANVDGAGIADPLRYGMGYKAKAAAGQAPPDGTSYIVTDPFGTSVVTPVRIDGVIAPGTLGYGAVPAPLAGNDDPYVCYRSVGIRETVPGRSTVHVVDAFEDREYRVRQPRSLCLPTSDTGNHGSPLLCYRVTRGRGEAKHKSIRHTLQTTDRFGSLAIDSRREYELCVTADYVPQS